MKRLISYTQRSSELYQREHMRLSDFFLALGIPYIILITTSLIVSCTFLAFNVPLSSAAFPVSIIITLVISFIFIRQLFPHRSFIISATVLVVTTIFFLCGHLYACGFYDFSYDGQWYHEDAMIFLKKGWNPYHHYLSEKEYHADELLNHYAQGAWIVRASYYIFSDLIESAKLFNFLLIWSSFFICAATLIRIRKNSLLFACAIAALAALNPIVVEFSLSYYVDGHVSSCSLIVISLFFLYVQTKRVPVLVLFCIALVYFVNIKFTALVFAGIFLSAGFIYLLVKKHSGIRRYVIASVTACVVALCFVGFPTYLTNTVVRHHPFYPLMGPGNIGEMISQVCYPADFFGLNRFEKLNRSLFAVPTWSRAPVTSQPKHLFDHFNPDFLTNFANGIAEISGFGPLFGECAMLMLFSVLIFLPFHFKNKNILNLLLVCGVLLVSVFIVPECWYFRYVPQLYFVFLLFIWIIHITSGKRIISPAWLLITVFFLNTYLILHPYVGFQKSHSVLIQEQLIELKKKSEVKPIVVYPGWMGSILIRLDEAGVRYQTNYEMEFRENCERFKMSEGQAFYIKP